MFWETVLEPELSPLSWAGLGWAAGAGASPKSGWMPGAASALLGRARPLTWVFPSPDQEADWGLDMVELTGSAEKRGLHCKPSFWVPKS